MATVRWCREAVAIVANTHHSFLFRRSLVLVSTVTETRQTFTTVEVEKLLDTFAKDRLGHAWHLALVGLRRGELCGLRWTDIDFEPQTMRIEITGVVVDGKVVEGDTKSETSTRVLPLTPELLAALRAATRMQAEEQLATGPTYERSGYVVVDPLGPALPPRHCVRLLGCGVCEGGREAHPAARRPTHLRHAHAPGAQRAGGDHLGVARARRHRVHYAHLRAQPTGEAGPRGREHLVVDEAYEVRTVGSLTCDFVLPRRSGNRKRFSDRFFRAPHGPKSRFPPPGVTARNRVDGK
jgi:integrase